MTYCSACGRSSPDDATFCAHCGAALNKPVFGYEAPASPELSPPPYAVPQAAAPVGGRGPVGRVVEPVLVLVLYLVTLGVYGAFYWWRVSKEVDAYTGRPGNAHSPARAGILTLVIATPLALGAYLFILLAIVATPGFDPESSQPPELTPEQAAAFGFPALILLLAAVAALVGQIVLYVAKWRVWRAIEADERARGLPAPLSPGLMLIFVLVPYVSLVTFWIAMHRTQKGLNGMWEAPVSGSWPAPP